VLLNLCTDGVLYIRILAKMTCHVKCNAGVVANSTSVSERIRYSQLSRPTVDTGI
jgi:hypothetical protein